MPRYYFPASSFSFRRRRCCSSPQFLRFSAGGKDFGLKTKLQQLFGKRVDTMQLPKILSLSENKKRVSFSWPTCAKRNSSSSFPFTSFVENIFVAAVELRCRNKSRTRKTNRKTPHPPSLRLKLHPEVPR